MKKLILAIVILFISVICASAQDVKTHPVTPDPTPEAVELLDYIYSISGEKIMSGQHCAPLIGSTRLPVVHRVTGEYPAVFGQDFGFSYPGYWDGINFRQRIVDEAIRRHHEGFIITLMWHAVPPTEDEPVTFRESIQGELTEADWKNLITPGTDLHERWKSQVDVIAWFLKQLQFANVPVLWRPYHEMNGGWFWWGKKPGEDGYKKLWRMMFNRFVHFHGLRNLIWVYNTNEFKDGVDPHDMYYPGDEVVDIIATDVYTEGYNQENYDQLLELAGDKPIALGEVGRVPDMEIIKSQPRWTWFMHWYDPGGGGEGFREYLEVYKSDQVIKLKDIPWSEIKNPVIHEPVLK